MRKMSKNEQLRLEVAERANFRCEYCKIHQDDMFISFEIDHIVAQKHGGGNEIENLAYACPHCNQHKGTDMVTFVDDYDDVIRIYNPRIDDWKKHFESTMGEIYSETKMGKATIKLLKMNDVDLIILRGLLSELDRYP
jgi:HNH endonuclease